MNKRKIIDYIFDELENNASIKFNEDKEYHNCLKIHQEKGEELFDYIKKNIYSKKLKKSLVPIIEHYIDSLRDCSYCAFKLYYYQGFVDGIDFITK